MGERIQIITAPLVNVRVTNNINAFMSEKRFDRGLTIGDLKGRLELITGASSGAMTIEVFDDDDKPVCSLDDDSALLGSYNVEENYRIHVTDISSNAAEFGDLSKVDKFELSADEYGKRSDSVRAYLMKNKLGKYNEEEQKRMLEEKLVADKAEEEKADTITLGSRCEVKCEGKATRRGEVMYNGKVHFKPGIWIGIKYDEPVGKNDGSIGEKKYFEAPMKYGGFVTPSNCEVGDFPELGDEEDEM